MQHFEEFVLSGYKVQQAKMLGEGSYGRVFKVYSEKRKQYVALKQINMQRIHEQQLEDLLEREIALMKELRSQNTVELIEDQIGKNYTYMVLELCEGDLRKQMVESKAKFPEAKVIDIFGQIIKGFSVLVEKSCIHRDIKPENILQKADNYKIGDFGFACKADIQGIEKMMEFCGTPVYMAPQLLFQEPYTSKCDVWSLGLMLFELIYGATPWPVRCIENYKKSLLTRHLAFPFNVKVGQHTKDFLKRALVVDEEKRMSWEELFNHPLIKDKMAGNPVCLNQVKPKLRKLLSMMQREADRKEVDQVKTFKSIEAEEGLDFLNFEKLLRNLNPSITTYEIRVLFSTCDKNEDGLIDKKQFEQLFCNTNFRSDPVAERELDEIIGIIVCKQIDLADLFQQFDHNKSGYLDYQEFKKMILSLAPRYREHQIVHLQKRLDTNKDGLIRVSEIFETLGKELVSQKQYRGLWHERGHRNIKALKMHLEEREMDGKAMLLMGDINRDQRIDLGQFLRLMEVVDFHVSEEEVKEVFKLVDRDSSDKLSFDELQKFLQS